MTLTVERLRELFEYDPVTGRLIWRSSLSPRAPVGSTAGCKHRDGGLVIQCAGKKYHVHRVIWAIIYGRWPADVIDHVDGNPANNRLENLRDATRGENCRNRRKSSRNTSGFKGVSRAGSAWQAVIGFNEKDIYLGRFKTKEAAAQAYNAAAIRHHGDFARLNAA